MNIIELFSGTGTISNIAAQKGHGTFSVDLRKRKGVCEPDLQADILKLNHSDLMSAIRARYSTWDKTHIVWASVPCTTFSYAAGDYHFSGTEPTSPEALEGIRLLKKTLKLIRELRPAYYFIENPQGRLRHLPVMLDWLCTNLGMTKKVTWGSYGFPTTKPTNIFTNAYGFQPRPLMAYGRGAKCKGNFNNLTVCQRQKIPELFAVEFVEYCESLFN